MQHTRSTSENRKLSAYGIPTKSAQIRHRAFRATKSRNRARRSALAPCSDTTAVGRLAASSATSPAAEVLSLPLPRESRPSERAQPDRAQPGPRPASRRDRGHGGARVDEHSGHGRPAGFQPPAPGRSEPGPRHSGNRPRPLPSCPDRPGSRQPASPPLLRGGVAVALMPACIAGRHCLPAVRRDPARREGRHRFRPGAGRSTDIRRERCAGACPRGLLRRLRGRRGHGLCTARRKAFTRGGLQAERGPPWRAWRRDHS